MPGTRRLVDINYYHEQIQNYSNHNPYCNASFSHNIFFDEFNDEMNSKLIFKCKLCVFLKNGKICSFPITNLSSERVTIHIGNNNSFTRQHLVLRTGCHFHFNIYTNKPYYVRKSVIIKVIVQV
jgi:hypothetical protein